MDCEDDRAAGQELRRIEVGKVDAKAAVPRRRIVNSLPSIRTPMDGCDCREFDPQDQACRHVAAFMVEAPDEVPRTDTVDLVALPRLRRHVEDAAVRQGA